MERIADVEQRKDAITAESAKYVAKHPQLKQLLHDFITTVLASKPDDIHLFARDYFAAFIPEKAPPTTTDAIGDESQLLSASEEAAAAAEREEAEEEQAARLKLEAAARASSR